jgi:hypothetical protein
MTIRANIGLVFEQVRHESGSARVRDVSHRTIENRTARMMINADSPEQLAEMTSAANVSAGGG